MATARVGAGGRELVGGSGRPGRQVHLDERVPGAGQMLACLDPLGASTQSRAVQELGTGHLVVLGSATATAEDGSKAEWIYVNVFHIDDGKITEVWGMTENDAAVDPFLDRLPD